MMLKAKDIMTQQVVTIHPEATVEELARLLIEHKISGVPVVDTGKNLLGIVTEKDLIDQNRRLHIPTVIRLFDAYFVLGSNKTEKDFNKMVATTVGEICTKKVVSITEDTTLQEIATLMTEKNIYTLPVLKGNTVVGIVGKADIVKAMTQYGKKQE
jgi:CBS domain-containing protein